MDDIKQGLQNGSLVPFLGLGVFEGTSLPYDSDSLILALNNGRAMSQRLMYEYSRAAMSLEQRKGREYLVALTNHIYTKEQYPLPYAYTVLQKKGIGYFIDTNLDDSAQKIYANVDHYLITGVSRIMGGYDRFVVYRFDKNTQNYTQTNKESLCSDIPIVFKPLGSTIPEKNFIISDADFVDWLTEAMGGYALPPFLKEYRKGKKYLFLGVDFSKDTFRMVSNEITIGLEGGYVVSGKKELSKKEQKFFDSHNLEHICMPLDEFFGEIS